jgi:exodeoxyribonuclease X
MSANGPPDYFCAHNAAFEREFFSGGETPWICTRKIGMRIWPDSPNFQNQVLRYHLGIDGDDGFDAWLSMPPHRAGPDCYVTAHILKRAILHGTAIDQMTAWTDQPSLLPGNINFGKHRGTPWSQLPADYLDWMCGAKDMDEEKKFTARHWLDRRRSDSR